MQSHTKFAEAVRLYQAGQVGDAERLCREIISDEPKQASAWHLLGRLEHQSGRGELAAQALKRAVEFNPTAAEVHYDLAVVLEATGRPDEAIVSYQRSLDLRPSYFDALYNLGNLFLLRRQLDEAIFCYRRAIAIRSDFAPLYTNLGVALTDTGHLDEAVACLAYALQLSPETPRIYNNLGNALRAQRKLNEAVASFQRALELNADYAEAHSNLSAVLRELGNPADAERHARRALELLPGHAATHGNLAIALHELGRFDEADVQFRRAIELDPGNPQLLFNWSTLKLHRGDLEQGFKLFELRRITGKAEQRIFLEPRWTGQPLAGRTLLLWTEPGFGDVFQFIRYSLVAKRHGATVVFQCPRAIVKLLASCPGIDRVVPEGDSLPPFDFHAPLMSLPAIFRTTLDTIPNEVPYLFADERLVADWREKLRAIDGFRIGINWQGSFTPGLHKKRDIPIEHFEALASVPGVRLISLQKGPVDESAARGHNAPAVRESKILDLGDFDTAHGGFMDTAAIMMNLNLVISSDTSIPNLAGALGVPVWIALAFIPEWRWLVDRNDSPWYPTMRLFRQKSLNDWSSVFAEIEAALGELI